MQRRIMLSVLSLLMLAMLAVVPTTQAQGDQRCFTETGFCIEGAIRTYWEKNGGLSVFGYPISDLHTETIEGWTGSVQWFERDRLEDHGTEGVMAGRLGVAVLELNGSSWYNFPTVTSAADGCLYFSQTSHSLCEPFKSYWEKNGGLERFGYPISESHDRTIGTWTGAVQYFERRRMEYHTENAGTPYEILLGLLGKEVFEAEGTCGAAMPELQDALTRIEFAVDLGCPGAVYEDLSASIQNMEYGLMIWVQYHTINDTMNDKIYVIPQWNKYEEYNDTWDSSMPDQPDVEAPADKFVPHRGFGKIWNDIPSVRSAMGFAVERTERAETATIQMFDSGLLIWMKGSDTVYALGPWQSKAVSRQ